MSRAQQGQTFDTASSQNQTNEANAQATEKREQGDIGNYQSQLSKFAAANPYVQGGEYATESNKELSNTADATAEAAKAEQQSLAQRTGQNPAAAIAAGEAEQQTAQRTLAGEEASATKDRLASGADYGKSVLAGAGAVPGMEHNLAALQQGAATGALNTQEDAAKTPSFMDELGQGLISGGVAVGSAYCPAHGSLILMADGSHKRVETLKAGDLVAGIDGDAQRVLSTHTGISPVVLVDTADGFTGRRSLTDSLLIPIGGYVAAAKSLGRVVLTDYGKSEVTQVRDGGINAVQALILDGAHTFQADGIWSIGMDESERIPVVGMEG